MGGMRNRCNQTVDGDHGRIETRRVWVSDEVKHLGESILSQWPALASVAAVERVCEGPQGRGDVERRYYISSLENPDAATMARCVRGHWGIENQLHWQLDVSFGEDQRRVRKDHGAENFSRLCRMSLN